VNIVEYLHLIIKIMIPVNFLGGYNRQVQERFFPEFLDKLCSLLVYLDKKFYKKCLITTKSEVKGVIRAAIGNPNSPDQHSDPSLLNLYPEKPTAEQAKLDSSLLPQRSFYELNTDILRLTSNLIHTSKEAQDFLIDSDYLMPLLSFSSFDEMNPLSREATIVLIRYVTDSNERARELIRGMEVKKLDPDSVNKFNSLSDQLDFI
jgi:hypothetical protein